MFTPSGSHTVWCKKCSFVSIEYRNVAGPRSWNNLAVDLRLSRTFSTFETHLKSRPVNISFLQFDCIIDYFLYIALCCIRLSNFVIITLHYIRELHCNESSIIVMQLQLVIDALAKWANEWQLSISTTKCCVLNVGKTIITTSLSIDGITLPVVAPFNININIIVVKSARDLGVLVSHDLSPSLHY